MFIEGFRHVGFSVEYARSQVFVCGYDDGLVVQFLLSREIQSCRREVRGGWLIVSTLHTSILRLKCIDSILDQVVCSVKHSML